MMYVPRDLPDLRPRTPKRDAWRIAASILGFLTVALFAVGIWTLV